MRKKHPEHVNLERWLVSYADFITLLFAFFVIMYALSQADMAKFKKASTSIRAAFGASGMIDLNGQSGGETANQFETLEVPGGRLMNMPAGKTHTASDPDPELQEMKELMEESVSLELGVSDFSEQMQMQYDSQGLIVRLAAKDFFDEGAVEVREDLRPILDRIGRVIVRTKRLIRIEGHTDPGEERAGSFNSGWELSTARAAWVVKYWVKRFDMDPKRFGAAGYAAFRPLTDKKDSWSRGKNRRIEIIILNNRYNNDTGF